MNLFGENHSNVATSYSILGALYKDLGNSVKDEEFYTKALTIYLNLFGENHLHVASSYNNLGILYKAQGAL